MSGLGGSVAEPPAAPEVTPEFRGLLGYLCGIGLTGCYFLYGFVEMGLDSIPLETPDAHEPPPPDPYPKSVIAAYALFLEAGLLIFSGPWSDPSNNIKFGCDDVGARDNMFWLVNAAPLIFDTFFFGIGLTDMTPEMARNTNNLGVLVDALGSVLTFAAACAVIEDSPSTKSFLVNAAYLLTQSSNFIRIARFGTITRALCWEDPEFVICAEVIAATAGRMDLLCDEVAAAVALAALITPKGR